MSTERALSRREVEVLGLICVGKSTKEIAAELGISPHTVKVHRDHVYHAVGVHTLAELVVHAIREGLVTVPGIQRIEAANG